MEEKLKPLPKFITNEIRQILEDCQSGKLRHDQTEWHCGTKHCIGGWKEVLDFAKFKKDRSVLTADIAHDRNFSRFVGGVIEDNPDAFWGYPQIQWRLTEREADMLFGGGATFNRQFALLEKLEKLEKGELVP